MQDQDRLQGPLTVLVEFEVRTLSAPTSEWLKVWGVRGADALTGEPDTTPYEAAVSETHDNQVLIFERYAQGQQSLDAHVGRQAHTELLETMGARNMTRRRAMTGMFADIPGYGWWSRPERTPTLQEAGLRLSLIITRFADADTRDRYIELTGAHARYCHEKEPGTLIYSGGLALGDSERGPGIRTGDLLFVAAFADDAAAAQHRDDPRHVALQPELARLDRERILLQSYRSTGKGFLWR